MSRILLTGANGFIGSHILDQLLRQRLSVRAVVRSPDKAARVRQDHPDAGDKLDFAIVPDISSPWAFDRAFASTQPFDIVIHTASPFLYRAGQSNLDFLNPAVKGTTELLHAIKANAPTVKSCDHQQLRGSVFFFFAQPINSGKVYSSNDWNPVTWEEALIGDTGLAYRASKKFAGLAVWDFLKNENPRFDLVVLCPPMVYGPLRHAVDRIEDLNESNSRIWKLFIDSSKDAEPPSQRRSPVRGCEGSGSCPCPGCNVIPSCQQAANNRQWQSVVTGNCSYSTPKLSQSGKPGTSSLPENAYEADPLPAKELLDMEFTPVERNLC